VRSFVGGGILAAVSWISFKKFGVNKNGYIIDVENDILEFPGGGIEAESWLSYFSPVFLMQGSNVIR